MQIRDYDLLNNVDVLFDKSIIIYGAGLYGRKSARLLDDAGLGVYCFCDRNESIKECMGHRVLSLNELEEKVKQEDCMIVIGSRYYCEEMIEELERRKISAYVCTWYGLQAGIEVNVGRDERFPNFFAEDFMKRKKVYMSHFINMAELNHFLYLCTTTIDVWVFQPQKTGSRTVEHTLYNAGLNVAHLHNMARRTELEARDEVATFFINNIKFRGGKFVVVVRDPIARALSFFMEYFRETFIIRSLEEEYDLAENARRFVMEEMRTNSELAWFDEELKSVTGIDIFQYPFDKEKGYVRIKERNVEVLVLTLEKLNENVAVLGEFVGKPNIQLCIRDIGEEEKIYKYIYTELKKHIRLPARVLDELYKENQQLDYFYTEEEKERFRMKWEKNVGLDEVDSQ